VGVKTVAFDARGKRVVSAGHDDVVRVWDAETGEKLRDLEGHSDHIFRVLFSPNGELVASSSDDRTVRLWQVADGTHKTFEGHSADVEELAFSRDGQWLASAGEDDRVGLWPVAGEGGTLLSGHERAVTAVAFMPSNNALVSASLDGTLALWGLPGGKTQKREKIHPGGATSLSVSDGGLIASCGRDGRVMVWDGKGTPRLVASHASPDRVSIAKDGSQVAYSSANGDVGLCDISSEAPTCRSLLGHGERVAAMHFTSDRALLVTGSEDGTIRVWSTQTGESRPLRMHDAPVFDIALFGDRIASASGDETVGLLELVPPPSPEKLRLRLGEITEMTLLSSLDAGAASPAAPSANSK
jgi:WD40 repeat protein